MGVGVNTTRNLHIQDTPVMVLIYVASPTQLWHEETLSGGYDTLHYMGIKATHTLERGQHLLHSV